jgi:hypothetical protein
VSEQDVSYHLDSESTLLSSRLANLSTSVNSDTKNYFFGVEAPKLNQGFISSWSSDVMSTTIRLLSIFDYCNKF